MNLTTNPSFGGANPSEGAAFEQLSAKEQAALIASFSTDQQRLAIRVLDPDDAADLLQSVDSALRDRLMLLLVPSARAEVSALLAYAEDVAGGLMNPRYIRVRPHMTVHEAIMYVRKQVGDSIYGGPGTSSYVYVLNQDQTLLGVISMKELLMADSTREVKAVMRPQIITLAENCANEEVANTFSKNRLIAIPVVDASGRMKGVVTADDVVTVVRSEATEDIHKMGGSQALDMPYLSTRLTDMVRKRGGWLILLFVGEMLTASAMAHFEDQIAKAVILALFVPLIISSGGNAGSQATTLIIRAMALGELKISDWWRVLRREICTGLALGLILACVGFLRIVLWQGVFGVYGEHFMLLGATVSLSLIGVVLWGTISGSILPLILRKLGFDPASASAPLVATLVDVTGVVIYFGLATVILAGTIL